MKYKENNIPAAPVTRTRSGSFAIVAEDCCRAKGRNF